MCKEVLKSNLEEETKITLIAALSSKDTSTHVYYPTQWWDPVKDWKQPNIYWQYPTVTSQNIEGGNTALFSNKVEVK